MGTKSKTGVGDSPINAKAERAATKTTQIHVPMAVGRLLDTNVPGPDISKRSAGQILTLPCGAQLALDHRGHAILYRAPQALSVPSCARITLDEAAAALDELAERLSTVERALLENLRESAGATDHRPHTDMVCAEVRDQDLQDRLADGVTGESVADSG